MMHFRKVVKAAMSFQLKSGSFLNGSAEIDVTANRDDLSLGKILPPLESTPAHSRPEQLY